MQVSKKNLSDTSVQLTITAESEQLQAIKAATLKRLGRDVKVQGFRAGKAPLALLEKQLDPSRLQSEFLDEVINKLYAEAVQDQKLRSVAQPEITVTKFVPFNTLEFTATVETVGAVTLPDYTKIKVEKQPVRVTAKDIEDVLGRLQTREAQKKEVKRASKDGDEVQIDFSGIDTKTKDPVQGADGKDFPLVLGSNTFIPGFEPALIGLKAGEEKKFEITFPADYGVKALQKRKVTFTATVKKVQAVTPPKLDNKFAASVGPFKTMQSLKDDIKQQLREERQREAERAYENELVTTIAEQATVAVPATLVDDQLEQMERDERQNLTYRGQTWQEHLDAEGVSEEQHRERERPQAELRVKIGLTLSEIAEREGVIVTPEEFEVRLQLLKGQYQDEQMQAELDKPEGRRDLLNRMVTEKTLAKLTAYAQG